MGVSYHSKELPEGQDLGNSVSWALGPEEAPWFLKETLWHLLSTPQSSHLNGDIALQSPEKKIQPSQSCLLPARIHPLIRLVEELAAAVMDRV